MLISFFRLNENLKVELTDYGLTKDLFDKNHVSNAGNSTKLLLKWMAPETLKTQEFSLKTDVVSFLINVISHFHFFLSFFVLVLCVLLLFDFCSSRKELSI